MTLDEALTFSKDKLERLKKNEVRYYHQSHA